MPKYKIYHIPNFVHYCGRVGKIGCSKQVDVRMKQNRKTSIKPFDFWEILEEYDCKKTAGIRERELQKQYGYKVDAIVYNGSVGRRKNYSQSDESKRKISDTLNGYKRTKENIANIRKAKMGDKNPMAKLNKYQVRYIRKWMPKTGKGKYTNERMAKALGVGSGTVRSCRLGLTYKDI